MGKKARLEIDGIADPGGVLDEDPGKSIADPAAINDTDLPTVEDPLMDPDGEIEKWRAEMIKQTTETLEILRKLYQLRSIGEQLGQTSQTENQEADPEADPEASAEADLPEKPKQKAQPQPENLRPDPEKKTRRRRKRELRLF